MHQGQGHDFLMDYTGAQSRLNTTGTVPWNRQGFFARKSVRMKAEGATIHTIVGKMSLSLSHATAEVSNSKFMEAQIGLPTAIAPPAVVSMVVHHLCRSVGTQGTCLTI